MGNIRTIDGLPIFDAKESLILHITNRDITRASTKQPNQCAVARACARQLHVKEARVHVGRIYLRLNDHNWVRYRTPKPLRTEIIAFDRGGRFEAGDYKIPPCEPTKRAAIGKRQGSKDKTKRSGRPAKNPRKYHMVQDVRGGPASG